MHVRQTASPTMYIKNDIRSDARKGKRKHEPRVRARIPAFS